MSAVGISAIALGLFVIASRAPLALAPASALRWFRKLIRNNGSTRGLGAVLLGLCGSLAWAGSTELTALAAILSLLGWFGLAISEAVLAFPSAYRELADMILPAVEEQRLRGWQTLGAVVACTGFIWIYVGIRAL